MSGLLAERSLLCDMPGCAECALGGREGRDGPLAWGVVRPIAGAVKRACSSEVCHPFGIGWRLKEYKPLDDPLVREEIGDSAVGEKYDSMGRSVGDAGTPVALLSCLVCNCNCGCGISLSMGNRGGGTRWPFDGKMLSPVPARDRRLVLDPFLPDW